jgi:membrane protein
MNPYWELVKDVGSSWQEDKAPRLGAALAFYSALSVAPLLVISLAIAGAVFGKDAARGQIMEQIDQLVGNEGAAIIEEVLANAREPGSGAVAMVLGVATMLFAASGVFGELQDSMNTIWGVQPKAGGGIWAMVKARFLSFTMVLGVGFLLLVSLILSAILGGIGSYLNGLMPQFVIVMRLLNFAVSFGVVTVLFAMIFKFLPDARIAWSDVWIGAAITALLFTIGKSAIGLYLGQSAAGSAYGAAGSLVIFLLWTYYSAQILILGAEFTQAYADRFGSHVVPLAGAAPTAKRSAAQEPSRA